TQIAKENAAEAERQKTEAEIQTKLAEKARDEANIARDEALAAKEAEAQQRAEAEAARQEALDNATLAKRNEIQAKENERIANLERARAEENEKEAIFQGEQARKSAAEALRQRYIAQAKAMAVKSKELNDPEQQALIAQQAFKFNSEHEGYEYDNDVYNGLYFALSKNEHALTKSLKAHDNGAARTLVTHAEDNTIYSGGSDGRIIRWRSVNGEWKSEILVERKDYQYYSIDVSHDEKYLVAAGLNTLSESNNYVEIYELGNMKAAPRKISGYSYGVENILIVPDGKGFFARDNSGRSIKYCDLTTAKE